MLTIGPDDAVPTSCDLYVIGGGEDLPQALAAAEAECRPTAAPGRRVGAVVLAVCAGLQILGQSFVGVDGKSCEGLGLLDCVTLRSSSPRAIGEVVVRPAPEWANSGLPTLTGFENHGAVTELGPGARAVGEVRVGVGNKDGSVEGAVGGRVWGTYLHGPVLARNPQLADLLLSWVVGPLAPIDDSEPDALHAERTEHGFIERTKASRANGHRWKWQK